MLALAYVEFRRVLQSLTLPVFDDNNDVQCCCGMCGHKAAVPSNRLEVDDAAHPEQGRAEAVPHL